jgi:hypothetical protein
MNIYSMVRRDPEKSGIPLYEPGTLVNLKRSPLTVSLISLQLANFDDIPPLSEAFLLCTGD